MSMDWHAGELLREGPRSEVWRGLEPGTIIKVYRDRGGRPPRTRAELEFTRLQHLHPALDQVEGVMCPRPITWGTRHGRHYLVMEEVPGVDLLALARRRVRPDPAGIGAPLARALMIYCEVVGEPHFGLKPADVLLDAATGVLVLLDFETEAKGRVSVAAGAGRAAAQSAGILLSRTLHLAAAPSTLHRRRETRWLVQAALSCARAFSETERQHVVQAVRQTYDYQTRLHGRWWRRPWYRLRWLDVAKPALASMDIARG
jgi:serine/threonine protein kinase